MINIQETHNCSGCGACVQKCPKQCILLQADNEGFLYPQVDTTICIDCGLCEKVCPVQNPSDARKPQQVLAAINKDEKIRMQSSSGGIFTLLAEKVINEGGVVFGARFDDEWQVTLDYSETTEGLAAFRGSKYVQARTGTTYQQCEQYLKTGRMVLYSGTPCQIAGLKHYLRKDYENLLTIDFVCHGVPSPLVWRKYLEEIVESAHRAVAGKSTVSSSLKPMSSIKEIRFRDKSNGWKKYRFVLKLNEPTGEVEKSSVSSCTNYLDESLFENMYMHAFLDNLTLRPSCYNCSSRSGKSASDISIADYWGVWDEHPDWFDNRGTSLILVYTEKGRRILLTIDAKMINTSFASALKGNPGINESPEIPQYRRYFWKQFARKGVTMAYLKVLNKQKPGFLKRLYGFIRRRIVK